MKATLKRHLPVILLILFEIAVGVLLLTNPEAFTNAVIIIFGAVCVVIGLIYFFKYLRARKREDASVLMLIGAIFSLTLGLFSIIASPLIITFFTFIAIMYAVIMIVSGLIKIQNYIINKRYHRPVSVITLVSAVIAVIVGVVILFNPFETTHILWMFVGIAILAEAAIDIAAIIYAFVLGAHPIDDGVATKVEIYESK